MVQIFLDLHFDLNAATLDSPFSETVNQSRAYLAQFGSDRAVKSVNNNNT